MDHCGHVKDQGLHHSDPPRFLPVVSVSEVAVKRLLGHDGAMDDVRIGNTLRVIRIRKHLRQADVARRAGVQRETVGRLERGGLGRVPHDTFRAVATALGIRVDVRLRWQGATSTAC